MNGVAAKPQKEFRAGAVRAAVQTDQRQTAEGRPFGSRRIQLERRYKDLQGSFQSTHCLDLNDLPKAILALMKAYEYLILRNAEATPKPGMARQLPPMGGSI